MVCTRCEAFYQEYPLVDGKHVLEPDDGEGGVYSAPIECAFPDGVFDGDNWSCRTMADLRTLVEEYYEERPRWPAWMMRDDTRSASIGVLPIPECGESSMDTQSRRDAIRQGYLVMTWYKDRGRTGQAWTMWDGESPQPLNIQTAEFILARYATDEEGR